MHVTISVEVLEWRREQALREAELEHPKEAPQGSSKVPTVSHWTVAWEPARATGLLRESFRTPKNAD